MNKSGNALVGTWWDAGWCEWPERSASSQSACSPPQARLLMHSHTCLSAAPQMFIWDTVHLWLGVGWNGHKVTRARNGKGKSEWGKVLLTHLQETLLLLQPHDPITYVTTNRVQTRPGKLIPLKINWECFVSGPSSAGHRKLEDRITFQTLSYLWLEMNIYQRAKEGESFARRGWSTAVEHLPSKGKDLGWIPGITKQASKQIHFMSLEHFYLFQNALMALNLAVTILWDGPDSSSPFSVW